MFIGEPDNNNITIKESGIQGLGVFANVTLLPNVPIGPTHYIKQTHSGLQATGISELGKFINHSIEPNCHARIQGKEILLESTEGILNGAELTVDYSDFKSISNIETPNLEFHGKSSG